MANSTIEVTEALDSTQKFVRLIDNSDGTYSIATAPQSLVPGAATSANQALELTQLQSMNLLSSVVYDSILVTYTDATKATISKVEWKLGGVVVKTLTPTFGSTTDLWAKS